VTTPRHICFLSDYGYEDDFAGTCRGVIASLAPGVSVIDITHGIARHDLLGAAFVLRNTARYMPDGAVHLAVVDPGVGTSRALVYARIGGQQFIVPDNGLLSRLAARMPPSKLVRLEDPTYWLPRVSTISMARTTRRGLRRSIPAAPSGSRRWSSPASVASPLKTSA